MRVRSVEVEVGQELNFRIACGPGRRHAEPSLLRVISTHNTHRQLVSVRRETRCGDESSGRDTAVQCAVLTMLPGIRIASRWPQLTELL